MGSSSADRESTHTVARSVARLTLASSTPWTPRSARSTLPTHAAQCMPFTGNSSRVLVSVRAMAHRPPKREKTSRSSSTFLCRSLAVPERIASATQDSMWRPSRSRWTCSTAPCTAVSCRRMSTQYLSSSTMRWMPCTCPSIRRRRPIVFALVSSSIISSPCSNAPLPSPRNARVCCSSTDLHLESFRGPAAHEPTQQPPARQRRREVLEAVAAHALAEREDPAVQRFEELGHPVNQQHRQQVAAASVARGGKPEQERDGERREELDERVRAQVAPTRGLARVPVHDAAEACGRERQQEGEPRRHIDALRDHRGQHSHEDQGHRQPIPDEPGIVRGPVVVGGSQARERDARTDAH